MFRRRSRAFVALSVSLLALSACSADAEVENPSAAAPTVDTVQESASPSPTPTPPARNDRGDIIKEIGDPAGAGYIDAEPHTIEFTVDGIEEVQCTDEWWTADDLAQEGNTLIAVDLAAVTQPASGEHADSWVDIESIDFSYGWVGFGTEGTRMNDLHGVATYSCLSNSELMPYEIGPGETVQGKVVLEVSDRAGEIAFRPWWLDGGGWSWSYDLDGPEGVDA